MKKNTPQKIIISALILLSFFVLISFNQAFAQTRNRNSLVLSANKQNIGTGETVSFKTEVTGTIGGIANKVVTVNSSAGGSQTCTMPGNAPFFCTVDMSFQTAGSFTLTSSVVFSNGTMNSNDLSVVIIDGATSVPVTPKCDELKGELLNANGECTEASKTQYELLAPLPGIGDDKGIIETKQNCAFGNYLNLLLKLIIGLAGVLALVRIVIGGLEYMTSEMITEKSAGKDTIRNALLGLFLALGSYIILNTINPDLLNTCMELEDVSIEISPRVTLQNRSGGGVCAPINDTSQPCHPSNLSVAFPGTTNDPAPFNTRAAQASAICSLESGGKANTTSGVDKCADGKAFSFGLFQINGSAHRNAIPACAGAFEIPTGHGSSQGNRIDGGYSWTCRTVEPAYTQCKNFLLNPMNNIAYASRLKSSNSWYPTWSTYSSCQNSFAK